VLKIRLRRTGAKKQPRYRVVVAESNAPRDGSFVEILGWYNPQADPAQVVINTEKAAEWIKRGAQPSDRVAYLLKQATSADTAADSAAAATPSAPVAAEPPADEEAAKPAGRGRSRSTRATTGAGEAAPEVAGETSGAAAEVSASEAPEEEGSAGTAG
jgi:small subunit ribosomal protein S16